MEDDARQAEERAQHQVFEARLGGSGDRHAVAVASAEANRDGQMYERRSRTRYPATARCLPNERS